MAGTGSSDGEECEWMRCVAQTRRKYLRSAGWAVNGLHFSLGDQVVCGIGETSNVSLSALTASLMLLLFFFTFLFSII